MRDEAPFQAGLRPEMDAEAYHADPCPAPSLSAGAANILINATPLHAWVESRRLNKAYEPAAKTAFDIGSAAHAMLTGKGAPIARIDAPDFRTKKAQHARDSARGEGKTPLVAKQYDAVREMVRAAREQMRAHGIGDPFEGGENEVPMFWLKAGVWRRAMADCIDPENRVIYDYKTCAGYAEPERWLRRSLDFGVDIRAAHYIDGVETITGDDDWRYRYVVQEKAPPYCLSVIELDSEALNIGRKKAEFAANTWRRCVESGQWPGYSAHIAMVSMPPWMVEQWLGREFSEADQRARTGRDSFDAALRWQAPLEQVS